MLCVRPQSLEGKIVAIIHPAWHSCGSHAVFCAQTTAYRAMGARVLSLAVGTRPDQGARNRRFWDYYYRMTADLLAHERFHTGTSRYTLLLSPARLRRALGLVNRDYAAQMAGLAELSPLPAGLTGRGRIDLVHCNHYFNMPLALRLKARCGAPILLETHDVQARQYELRGATSLYSGRRSSLAEMESSELALVAKADVLAHINADEHAYFSARLPAARHVLLYPALSAPPPDRGQHFLAVASANYPNYLGILWLLERVLPLAGPVPLAILGNVDREIAARAPGLYQRHRHAFKGRVDDLKPYYDTAAAVLLPVVAGHGLAIKTVEALESGAPLIATGLAFRGMGIDPATIENARLGDTPDVFARHIAEVDSETATAAATGLAAPCAMPPPDRDRERKMTEREWLELQQARARRRTASSRRIFNDLFSFPKYVERLERVATALALAGAAGPARDACFEGGPAPHRPRAQLPAGAFAERARHAGNGVAL